MAAAAVSCLGRSVPRSPRNLRRTLPPSETPAMASLNHGLGTMIFLNFSVSEFSSNLARQRIFPAWMQEIVKNLTSDEHFTVDGTLIEAWASLKSFQRKDGSGKGDGSNFHGEQRRNDSRQSKTDPEAKRTAKARDKNRD